MTPEQREYATAIQSSGDALRTLINDILDFSKIEAGHLSLEVQPLDLRQVASEVAAVFTPQVRAKGLQIRGEARPGTPGARRAPPAERGGANRARGRILVAEDNAINQLVAVRLLESLGYVVETVQTGRQAVEAMRQGQYDLVLMDCHMPELDGFAATAAIRQHEAGRGQHTPIVAVTADALVGDAEKSLAAGMDDYLAKPITVERLEAVVGQWMADGGPADRSEDGREAMDLGFLATLKDLGRRSQPQLRYNGYNACCWIAP